MDWNGTRIALKLAVLPALLASQAVSAKQDTVRLTGLSDVSLGSLGTGGDAITAQSVCAYSSTNTSGYNVTALGTGASNALEVNSTSGKLPLSVLWSDQPNQTTGTQLVAGNPSATFYSTATHQFCANGPPVSASFIIRIHDADIQSAPAGAYSGTITLIIAPA